MDYYEKCLLILKWSKNIKKFNTTFIESLIEYYNEHNEFTISQENAIDNIIYKWKIT